ncbi:hypothetical protein ACJMK2_026406 [Sinanodonta woodiana]|uniref:Uncharacterized protein n=1 Tax=Sinanodonta woodiana TaxID=1069815 RepID=A0ABD3XN80_SINWO
MEKKLVVAFYVFYSVCCCVFVESVHDRVEDFAERKLEDCHDMLKELVICLRSRSLMLEKLRDCDSALEQAVLCLSHEQYDDYFRPDQSVFLQQALSLEKRGLGRCIHNCLQGRGRMNFIQCKSMCH